MRHQEDLGDGEGTAPSGTPIRFFSPLGRKGRGGDGFGKKGSRGGDGSLGEKRILRIGEEICVSMRQYV